jgi:hypothetical protein
VKRLVFGTERRRRRDESILPADSEACIQEARMKLHRILQRFDRPRIADIEAFVRGETLKSGVTFSKGASIAITAGSRGVANIDRITKTVVEMVVEAGARPFIVPAMGSHGGATPDGQVEVLASYGITEQAMECPIRSSMEVVEMPSEGLMNEAFMDRHAWDSDGVILINRIKPHTDFHGAYESGLVKMAVIGLGKEAQAFELHRFGVRGLRDFVPETAKRVFATGKILMGVGIVENAYDETAIVEAIRGDLIMKREPDLLARARSNMPRLPVNDLDVLIVDRLGKNISGTGMDTNIIGRIRIPGQPDPETPRIQNIIVRDLTEESHGNATGMGLADVTTRRFHEKIDFAVTNKNILTSGFLERGKMPYVAQTDAEALEVALRASGCVEMGQARVIRIKDTLHLGEMMVSSSVLAELERAGEVEVVGEPVEALQADGELAPFRFV